jgi:hypothetical protein
MKFPYLLIATFAGFLFLAGCQKTIDPGDVSVGTLKDTTTGACSPVVVNGIFIVDSVLTVNHYVDIKVNVITGGTFDIKSDSVNGFSFRKSGTIGEGPGTVRLYATGKPLTSGVSTFQITYGASSCSFSITVYAGGSGNGTALYTLGGSPGNCSVSSVNGTYTAGQAMTAGNTVEMTVNVTTIGTYIITGPVVNGVAFNATGNFINTGIQNIFLTATGTPATAGNFNYPVTNSATSCNFSISFLPAAPPAAYTLGGSPGSCTGVIVSGTYMAGFALTASNTATVSVNVTGVGSYSMTTTTVNGITFSKSGIFTSTGAQTVILNGTGTPVAATTSNFPLTGGGNTCTFSVVVAPAPVAAYSMDCAAATVNGTYYVGSAVNASNTISLPVNVTAIGSYIISALPAVNGISFSKSGTFTTTGPQIVVIPASGTPTTAGPFNYTLNGLGTPCTFSITAVTGSPAFYSCKINGVYTEFTDRAVADIDDNGTPYLYMNGYTGPPTGGFVPQFQIFIKMNNNSAVAAGSYNENGLLLPNGYRIDIYYKAENPDMSVTIWNTSSNDFPPPNPPFTITVTSITATRVIGTFSGELTNTLQGSTIRKTITEGVFNLPVN